MEKIICTCGFEQIEDEAHCWNCGKQIREKRYPEDFLSEEEQRTESDADLKN